MTKVNEAMYVVLAYQPTEAVEGGDDASGA
jgi:hypothetical protein